MTSLLIALILAAALSVSHLASHPNLPYKLTKDVGTKLKGTPCALTKDRHLLFADKSTLKLGDYNYHYPLKLRFVFKLLTLFD